MRSFRYAVFLLASCAVAVYAQPIVTAHDECGIPCRLGPGIQITSALSEGAYEATEVILLQPLPNHCPLGKMLKMNPVDAQGHIDATRFRLGLRYPQSPFLADWFAGAGLHVYDVERRTPCFIKRSPTMQTQLQYVSLTTLRPTSEPDRYRVKRAVQTPTDKEGQLMLVFNDRVDAVLCPNGALITQLGDHS